MPENRTFTRVALNGKIWVKSSLTALSFTEFSGPEGNVTERPSFSTESANYCLTPRGGWSSCSSADLLGGNVCFGAIRACHHIPQKLPGILTSPHRDNAEHGHRHLAQHGFRPEGLIENNLQDWVPSPSAGAWHKPLAREAAEHGHTTSIVRFDPGSYFSRHEHPLGEEILVLSGEFQG